MATSPASLVICYSALCVLCMANLTSGQCVAKFNFLGFNHTTAITAPTTSNLTTTTTTSNITLIIQKGSSLNVQFSIVTENCFNDTDNHPNFTIMVRKRKRRSGYEAFCKIKRNASGTYTSFRTNVCGSDDGGKGNLFLREEDLDLTDETTWRLNAVSEDRKLEANATINVVFEYPPKVTALKFQCGKREDACLQPLEPGTQVNISCTYEAERPPVSKAALSIIYGTEKVAGDKLEMKPRMKGWKWYRYRYRYMYSVEEVRCEDAGTVSCSVAGASKNISSTLLVKCPPRILGNRSRRFEGNVSQPLELQFPVYSYTANFTACSLTSKRLGPRQGQGQQEYAEDEVNDGKVVGDENCSQPGREFSVLGTPPSLTLKLVLHKLTPTDVGEKLLIVSNGAGSDDVQFDLQILHSKPTHSLGDPGTPAEDDAGAGDDESNAALINGIVKCATAVFILTCLVIGVVVVKRRRCSCVPRRIFFRPGDTHRNVPSCYFNADHGSRHCPPVNDDSDDSDTMYANPDYHHPIPPPPPPRTPPHAAYAEDYSEGSDTMYADADYLHPIAPSPTPPPAAGAESMDLSRKTTRIADDSDGSDTMNANPDYHHPIPPPPPPRTPPPVACTDDYSEGSDTMYADADYLHSIAPSPTPPPAAGAESMDLSRKTTRIADDSDGSDTMNANPDYHHPIPPPPPPRTPPPVACTDDYSQGSDTMYTDADYLHPIAPPPTSPPAAGAESMDLSPLPPPLPSETKNINQSTEHTSQSPPPRKTRRLPSDRLPEPPHP